MHPYQILEVANTHGGSLNYLFELIDEFQEFKGYGMKFQPLHPDKIATKDYAWYNVYKELVFKPEEWKSIVQRAHKYKDIWIDLFDEYGVEVFHENRDTIKGVKLQASVLYNQKVLDRLSSASGLKDQVLIINISGYESSRIEERINYLLIKLRPLDLWIEVGFQAYPTELQDSGFVKIRHVKELFGRVVVFADHADAKGEDSIWLPIVAALNGADVIEKHVRHSTLETKHDHYSSLPKKQYEGYIKKLTSYLALNSQPFINKRESEYLQNSLQIPISAQRLSSGSLIDISKDLEFKRSGLKGLTSYDIQQLQSGFHILSVDVEKAKPILKKDFKKAIIATIIACRLKSTRLPKKALLKIGSLSSVERCIQSCKRFKDVNQTVLATSNLPEDAELENYCFDSSVIFHTGDPDDVIKRYLTICESLKIDVIIRVTADCPFVSDEIIDLLLKSHFQTGADYTASRISAVGSSAEIINKSALNKIKYHFPNAKYSEYMSWYFQNNPSYFKLNFVDLPSQLLRGYRLTLDYEEDLEMFNLIQNELDSLSLEGSIREIFSFLDTNQEVANLNAHLTLKYQTDATLIKTLNEETKIRVSE